MQPDTRTGNQNSGTDSPPKGGASGFLLSQQNPNLQYHSDDITITRLAEGPGVSLWCHYLRQVHVRHHCTTSTILTPSRGLQHLSNGCHNSVHLSHLLLHPLDVSNVVSNKIPRDD